MLSQFICKEWLDQAFWLKPLGLVKKIVLVVMVLQRSRYQAVTGKIYWLKQHFSYCLQLVEGLLKLNIM